MSSYAQQLQREHIERRNRLHPVQPPRIPLAAKILRIEPEIPPDLLVWPSRDMIDHSPGAVRRMIFATPQPIEPPPPARPTVRHIQIVVGRYFDVELEDLNSQRKHTAVVRPRQIAMYLARHLTTRTLPEIGKLFGGRDHTTVLHAVRKITGLLPNDPHMEADIRAIEKMLGVTR